MGRTSDILRKNDLCRAEEGLLKAGEGCRVRLADEADERGHTLEAVLVEPRVAWVLADLTQDAHQTTEDYLGMGRKLSTGGDDHPHHALHQVVVLGNLLRSSTTLNVGEQGHQDALREGADIGVVEAAA